MSVVFPRFPCVISFALFFSGYCVLLCVLADLVTNVPAPAPFQAEQALEIAELTELLNRNRQVIGRIDKKCRESDNVRMTYVNDDSDG